MQVSREIDYGMRAMVVLAAHADEVLPKRRIAGEFCIPVNFLALILPKLVRAGLVESLPGPHGGYRLAKPQARVSMYDVVCAIGGEVAFNRCFDPPHGCKLASRCPAKPYWQELAKLASDYLRGVTLDRMSLGARAR